MKDSTLRKLIFLSLNLPENGSIDDKLMSELVHDFCINSLSPNTVPDDEEEEDVTEEGNDEVVVDEGEEDEEDDITEATQKDVADQLYMDSGRKLKFAHYKLWKEARNTISDWQRCFRENPALVLTPKEAQEAVAALNMKQ